MIGLVKRQTRNFELTVCGMVKAAPPFVGGKLSRLSNDDNLGRRE